MTARRATGPSSVVVDAILDRANHSCEACGKGLSDRRGVDWSVQHRVPRGAGGTRALWINKPSNLMILCGSATTPGSCHEFTESHRVAAVAAGWLIQARQDPRTVEVLICRVFRYLGDDARYHNEPQGGSSVTTSSTPGQGETCDRVHVSSSSPGPGTTQERFESWVGHRMDCAYMRSLDDIDDVDECDCDLLDNDGDFWDEDDEEWP